MGNLNYVTILAEWYLYIQFLEVTLMQWQDQLACDLLRFPEDAKIKQARQTGKSFILGLLVFFIAFYLKWNVILTAPKLDQTQEIFGVVHAVKNAVDRKMRRQRRGRLRLNVDNRYELDFKGRGSVRGLSGSESAHVEGASGNLIIADEHQDLVWARVAEVFKNMLAGSIIFQSEKTEGLVPFWSSGIGGSSESVAERAGCDYEWEYPWRSVYDTLISEGRERDAERYKKFIDEQRVSMFPEEFAAHHECKKLDTSDKVLVPDIFPYDELLEGIVTVGFDFGRSIDKTVGTVLRNAPVNDKRDDDLYFLTDWLVEIGSLDSQHDRVVDWLKSEGVVWDNINAEVNGIGHGPTDWLSREFPEVNGITVSSRWITRQAQKIARLCANKQMRYNREAKHANVFVRDIKKITYAMTNTSEITIKEHSDFLSSLMISINEPKWGSVAA